MDPNAPLLPQVIKLVRNAISGWYYLHHAAYRLEGAAEAIHQFRLRGREISAALNDAAPVDIVDVFESDDEAHKAAQNWLLVNGPTFDDLVQTTLISPEAMEEMNNNAPDVAKALKTVQAAKLGMISTEDALDTLQTDFIIPNKKHDHVAFLAPVTHHKM